MEMKGIIMFGILMEILFVIKINRMMVFGMKGNKMKKG